MSARLSLLSLALVWGLFTGCATTSKPITVSAPEARLTDLMVSRLEVAHQVAWIKFVDHLKVRDPQRETELVNKMVADGQRRGLDPKTVSTFFRAQIAASCLVQEESIRHWKRGATLPAYPPRDLKRDIRPQLDAIGSQLLNELALIKTPAPGLRAYANQTIRRKSFSWIVARRATAPLP